MPLLLPMMSMPPITVTTEVIDAPIPLGYWGAWITLIGAGGNGVTGTHVANENQFVSGGGGGGGGSRIGRSFVPVSVMGSTYTLSAGTTASRFSRFISGEIGLYAGWGVLGNAGLASITAVEVSSGGTSYIVLDGQYELLPGVILNGGRGGSGGGGGAGSPLPSTGSPGGNTTNGAGGGGGGGGGGKAATGGNRAGGVGGVSTGGDPVGVGNGRQGLSSTRVGNGATGGAGGGGGGAIAATTGTLGAAGSIRIEWV